MDKQLISYDPLNGIAQYHIYDDATDTSYFQSVGDATPIIEQNKALANSDNWKNGVKQDFALYASIPAIVQLKWLTEDGIDVYKKEHAHRVSKKLEDPEYRYLKATSKKHLMLSHD